MICKNCGKFIADKAMACPNCGTIYHSDFVPAKKETANAQKRTIPVYSAETFRMRLQEEAAVLTLIQKNKRINAEEEARRTELELTEEEKLEAYESRLDALYEKYSNLPEEAEVSEKDSTEIDEKSEVNAETQAETEVKEDVKAKTATEETTGETVDSEETSEKELNSESDEKSDGAESDIEDEFENEEISDKSDSEREDLNVEEDSENVTTEETETSEDSSENEEIVETEESSSSETEETEEASTGNEVEENKETEEPADLSEESEKETDDISDEEKADNEVEETEDVDETDDNPDEISDEMESEKEDPDLDEDSEDVTTEEDETEFVMSDEETDGDTDGDTAEASEESDSAEEVEDTDELIETSEEVGEEPEASEDASEHDTEETEVPEADEAEDDEKSEVPETDEAEDDEESEVPETDEAEDGEESEVPETDEAENDEKSEVEDAEPEENSENDEVSETSDGKPKILKLNAAEGTAFHVTEEEAVLEATAKKIGPFTFHPEKFHFNVKYVAIGAAVTAIVISAVFWFNTPERRETRAMNRGAAAVSSSDYTTAEDAYRTVLSLNHRNENAYLKMADVYLKMDRHKDAVTLIQEGLQELPGSAALKKKLEELNPVIAFNVESGTYADPVELTLKTDDDSTIMFHFTKDGNRKEDQVYQKPLNLNSNGKYQIAAHAITKDGYAGPEAIVDITVALNPDKYHLNDWSELKDGSRSFIDADGNALTGWQEINGKKYYFDDNGKEAVGKTTIGNDIYFFDAEDGLQTGWQHDDQQVYYYFDEEGRMLTDTWIDDTYYVDAEGKMLTNGETPDGATMDNEGRKVFDFKSEIARYPDTMAIIESKTRKMDGDVATFKARIYHKHDKDKPTGDYYEATIRIHDHAWLHYTDQNLPDIWAKDAYNFLPTINVMNPTMDENGVIVKFDFILGSQK